MHGLKLTGGKTYSARLNIPKDRWQDVGRVYRTKSGIKQEVIRSLQTRDAREAIRRRDKALAEMRAEVDHRLIQAGLKPLHGAWCPEWATEDRIVSDALAARQEIQEQPDTSAEPDLPYTDPDYGRTHQDLQRDAILDLLSDRVDILRSHGADGEAYGSKFLRILDEKETPIGPLLDRWETDRKGIVSASSLALDKTAWRIFAAFVVEHEPTPPTLKDPMAFLKTKGIETLSPRLLGAFPEWLMHTKGLSAKTTSSRISSLKSFWDFCIRKHIISSPNPWDGATTGLKKRALRQDQTKPQRREFSEQELVCILSADPDEGRRWAWGSAIHDLMRLALLTGARENELCSLTIQRIINQDGAKGPLWGISILDSEAKTVNSVRCVPLHPIVRPIIARRLSAAIATGEPDAPLFPECKPGGTGAKRCFYFSKSFTLFRRALLGQDSNDIVNFHSFRKNFGTFMRRAHIAGVPECSLPITQKLMGHAPSTLTEGVYMEKELPWAIYEKAILGMVDKGLPESVLLAAKGKRQ
ncbi:hypothetical protein AA18889_1071 [Acetobacter senegalensis DSM 18889]|nr:hypothetical protein AA18889_1071 [Acetobacter senegalensis DSM 18889]